MHGSILGFVIVNAEVDFMGGVIDSGGGIGVKTSPRQAAFEKAQAELRQEYDVREERRRELEFLEKGGNPLDFKFGNTTSHSVQSPSSTDQQADQLVNSEVKDSFALTASPHGDSVESGGRPGVPTVSEPNTADNLLLFDGEKELLERETNSRSFNKRNKAESVRCSQENTNQNVKETEDSAIFRPYARRNRSKINRDSARPNSTELAQSRGGLVTSLSIRRGSVDGKSSTPQTANQKNRHITSMSCPSSATSNGNINSKSLVSNNLLNSEAEDLLVGREMSVSTRSSPLKEEADVTLRKNSSVVACGEAELAGEKAQAVPASTEIQAHEAAAIAGQEIMPTQLNGLVDFKGEKKSLANTATARSEGLDSESSHANNVGVDVDNEKDLHGVDKADINGICMQRTLRVEGLLNNNGSEMVNTKNENEVCGTIAGVNVRTYVDENQTKLVKTEIQSQRSTSELQNEEKCSSEAERKQEVDLAVSGDDRKVGDGLADKSSNHFYPGKPQASAEISSGVVNKNVVSGVDIVASKRQTDPEGGSILVDTMKEDSILEEARVIKAKRKKVAELSFSTVPVEVHMKSQWDFVLEEMTWLANDFAQERLWKMTVASQICHQIAFTSQLISEQRIQHGKLKTLASTLGNAILLFWSSVELPGEEIEETSLIDAKVDAKGTTDKESSTELGCESHGKCSAAGVIEYARRFLKYNNSSVPPLQAPPPSTPDNLRDPGILETSWDDQLTEESLFYSVPPGAMEAYRKSIESHLTRYGKSRSSIQEEVETSDYDAAGDTGYNAIVYDDDEGETSTYYLPGAFECIQSSNLSRKKRKNLLKSYDIGADLPCGSYTGASNQPTLMGKRPASNINVGSVPTKRMRTASRQRIISPFGGATAGNLPVPSKTDASSGDTDSFQDEQSSLHGGSGVQKGTEVESTGNFERRLPYDLAETFGKSKKKKKAHLVGSGYDQAWHLDSTVHGEQDHWKKRPEANHFDMNGLYGPHGAKKQKIAKHSAGNNFDSSTPVIGSIPSPVGSQMSNMSNPNKFIKLIGGRERGRKIKGLKISSGQQCSGNPWSLFEDQVLVVLVHDMGPNWELISDAMNSNLKIKYIHRNPSECKERHKNLMDRNAGDDSVEDSGTSQPYPSTLPGIPKGSARQLFQRLQGPMEEDTLKSHFEKICLIGKKFHCRGTQNNTRDPKQIVPVHNSQVMALSQVFPNNLNGSVLTPLDLCDASTSGQDVFTLENPGLPVLNQGMSGLPTSGANPCISGSGAMLGNNLSTTSGPPSAPIRDGRFNVPRGSLPLEEQHRLQYNQMLSGRNPQQQPTLPTAGAVPRPDRGHRMVPPGGNAMGGSRGTPLSRPGFQGMGSPSMPSSGSMLSSGMAGMPSTGNIHSGVGPSQGNSTLRPREAMQHMMRMQAAQGNGQGIPAFSGLSAGFTNQTTPPVQTYPGHLSQPPHVLGNTHHPHLQNPSHATGAQQAFASRQRQMHQRCMQQQQQFPASGAAMSHGSPQPQVPPISSSPQNSPLMQSSLVSSQPLSMPPATTSPIMTATGQQTPQKPQLPPHALGRNPQSGVSGANSQAGKQRHRQLQQQFQQSGRQHPHQRQPTQGQQPNKLLKGMGRGNMMQQSISVDPSNLNGLTMAPGMQIIEKRETAVPSIPSQPSITGTNTGTHQQSKPLVPSQSSNLSHPQPKAFPSTPSPSSQPVQPMRVHADNSIQGQVSPLVAGNSLSTSGPSVSMTATPSNHQHLLQHQKQGNQAAQKILQHNHLGNSDLSGKSKTVRTPGDPQSVNNINPMLNTSATKGVTPQPSIDSTNIRAAVSVSPATDSPPKASETPLSDSSVQNTATSKVVSSSLTDSVGSDAVPMSGQGIGQQHFHGLNARTQKPQQRQLSEQQQQQQQPVQNQKHLPAAGKPQPEQNSLLQAAEENTCSGPPDTKVE
ncbi:PREDICTED: chromatin modification-related protein EAF1 B-like isoform X2 [Tarenaya hassleriana]|uniref:chromatin modification-related protein EAF1 B-like isoform X2 n=1 Tax=Tarenaya hassleriana TaxID=28532 RepID=UPI00053C19BF|nr:PREDICTED: chromatin modification-related protein EAF1 B-like isoform X2 [Tarenaya hassleriana]